MDKSDVMTKETMNKQDDGKTDEKTCTKACADAQGNEQENVQESAQEKPAEGAAEKAPEKTPFTPELVVAVIQAHVKEIWEMRETIRSGKLDLARAQAMEKQFIDRLTVTLLGRNPLLEYRIPEVGEGLLERMEREHPDLFKPLSTLHESALPADANEEQRMHYVAERFGFETHGLVARILGFFMAADKAASTDEMKTETAQANAAMEAQRAIAEFTERWKRIIVGVPN